MAPAFAEAEIPVDAAIETSSHARPQSPAHGSVLIDRACGLLGVSKRTIYYWIRAGHLRTIRTRGGSQRILLASIHDLNTGGAGRRPRRSPQLLASKS
jgi:excisionase family DNA binding protein